MVDIAVVLSALGGVVLGMFLGVGAIAIDRRRLIRTLVARANTEELQTIERLIDERRQVQGAAAVRQLP